MQERESLQLVRAKSLEIRTSCPKTVQALQLWVLDRPETSGEGLRARHRWEWQRDDGGCDKSVAEAQEVVGRQFVVPAQAFLALGRRYSER